MARAKRLRNTPEHPLSERYIVEAAIAYANGAAIKLNDQAPMPSGGWLRDVILLSVLDPEAAAREAIEREVHIGAPMRVVLSMAQGGLHVRTHYETYSAVDLLSVALVLILDVDRDFGEKIHQCQLSACGRLFFERRPPTGRPQTRYCSREHMLQAHAESGPERTRRSRARAKQREKRR